jgi:hypothetical protein
LTRRQRSDFATIEVTNRGSVVQDHTAYWENSDELIGRVAAAVSRHTSTAIPLHQLAPGDADWIEGAGERRRWRVRLLVLQRWVIALSGLLTLLDLDRLREVGRYLNDHGTPVTSLFQSPERAAEGLLPDLPLALVGVGLGCLVVSSLSSLLWNYWDQRYVRERYLRRQPQDANGLALVLMAFAALAACTIGLGTYLAGFSNDFSMSIAACLFFGILFLPLLALS